MTSIIIPPSGDGYGWVVVHEIGHYYWGWAAGGNFWFQEASADFLAFLTLYVQDQERVVWLATRLATERAYLESQCVSRGVGSIQQIIDALAKNPAASDYLRCAYPYGEYLFGSLYVTIGQENFMAAWRELYRASTSAKRRLEEREIYLTFLKHTPPEKVIDVKALYKRVHGASFAN